MVTDQIKLQSHFFFQSIYFIIINIGEFIYYFSTMQLLTIIIFIHSHTTTLIPVVLYMVSSFATIGYSEIFSLWAFTQPHHGEPCNIIFVFLVIWTFVVDILCRLLHVCMCVCVMCVGGLGFSLHEIGIVLTIASVLQFPVNLFAFPIVSYECGEPLGTI